MVKGNTEAAAALLGGSLNSGGYHSVRRLLNRTEGGYTSLILAVLSEDASMVQLLAGQQPGQYGGHLWKTTINTQGVGGATALMEACKFGDLACVQHILQHKDVGVDVADDDGVTPLMEAVRVCTTPNTHHPRNVHRHCHGTYTTHATCTGIAAVLPLT